MIAERRLAAPRSERILGPLQAAGIRLDLERFAGLLRRLDSPHLRLPTVLVAGTNGKGSTAAMLAGIVHAAGYRVGLYTSPHLETVLERLRIGGRAISDQRLAEALERVVGEARRDHLPTHFEALTGAAFLLFALESLDLAVLEVGLGGRLDATNVADPLLSLVTTIGLDHREFLGDTLYAIAREKAGVFRRDRPALLGEIEGEALVALIDVARERGARLHRPEPTWRVDSGADAEAEQAIEISGPPGWGVRTHLALAGEHQRGNALLAVRAAEALSRLGLSRLGPESAARGLAACRWPGRLEAVVIGDDRSVIFDGAHNEAAASALARHLRRWSEPYDMLVGALADKQPLDWMPDLVRGARTVWVTTVPSPRSLAAEALAAGLSRSSIVVREPDEALRVALTTAPRRLLVTGSLYLVGALRGALRALTGQPAATHETSLF